MKLPWVKFTERKPEWGKPLLLFFGQTLEESSSGLKGIFISYGGMVKLGNGKVKFEQLNSEFSSSEEDPIPTPDDLNSLYWFELSNPKEEKLSFGEQILQDVYESSQEESYHC